MICKYLLSFSRFCFYSVDGSSVHKLFSLMSYHLLLLLSLFLSDSKNHLQDLCQGTCHIYIFFYEFYGFTSSIQVFNPFYFLCMVLDSGPVSFFCKWLPVFPTMFIKEIIVFLHCVFLASLSYIN